MERMQNSHVTAHSPVARHLAGWPRRWFVLVALTLLVVAGLATGAATAHVMNGESVADAPAAPEELPAPTTAAELPVPGIDAVEGVSPCDNSEVVAALDAGDASAVIAAFGGAEVFRAHVAAGTAPCIRHDDGAWPWLVVNKQRTLDPVDYRPAELVPPSRVVASGLNLRPVAADALNRLIEAADEEGAGDMAMTSGFRSHGYQSTLFASYADRRGVEAAELTSARPGHSEHQTGLAADMVACDPGCGSHRRFGPTPQGQWTAENSWRFGWIVRYEEGYTDITGYSPEPWHLRYIGEELAEAYHEGGYRTLEDFFGLPPAPTY